MVAGDARGGTLGFPTANLRLDPLLLVPAFGIYAGAAEGHRAAISIGTNPHYGGEERRVEAFLLDFEGDLYGRRLVLQLWQRLREERAFESEAGARGPDRAGRRADADRRTALAPVGSEGRPHLCRYGETDLSDARPTSSGAWTAAPSTASRATRTRREGARPAAASGWIVTSRRPGPTTAELSASFARFRVSVQTWSRSEGTDAACGCFESVSCLDCGSVYAKPAGGGTPAANPGCPDCGYLGWLPVRLTSGSQRRRSGAGRRGAGPRDDADAAEVVVPRRPAADPKPAASSASSAPSSDARLGVDDAGRRVEARPLDGRLRIEALVEDRRPRRGRAPCEPRAAGGAACEREPVAVERERRRHHARHPLARTSGPRTGRPRRACCSGARRDPGGSRPSRGRGST